MAYDKTSIRSRFVAALQAGKTTEEATEFANGIKAPMREKAEVPPLPAKVADAAKGGKQPDKTPKDGKTAKGGK